MPARCNLIIDSCCDLPPDVVDRPGVDLVALAVFCVGHADCEDDMNKLQKMLPGDGSALKCVGQPIGPVIGSHVGPGMVALAFWNREGRGA